MNQPPVLVVGGSDEFQRRRLVAKITTTRRNEGWNVVPVDGKDPGALDPIFAMASMFEANNLCVVTNPEKLPLAVVADHLKDPDPKVVLLMVTESDKPSGPVLDLVPKNSVKVFSLPAFYKLDEYAAAFVVSEVKARGSSISQDLALALVRRAGNDLGVLSFEVQKACMFAGQGQAVTAEHLRETIASLVESDGSALLDALGVRNEKRLAIEMAKYQASRGGDPTIELCGRILTPALTRWLQAAHLNAAGMSASAAAGSVGANPWYWEHKVLPYAVRWKVPGCAKLIGIVASAQTLVFKGGISPFAFLEAEFFALLRA